MHFWASVGACSLRATLLGVPRLPRSCTDRHEPGGTRTASLPAVLGRARGTPRQGRQFCAGSRVPCKGKPSCACKELVCLQLHRLPDGSYIYVNQTSDTEMFLNLSPSIGQCCASHLLTPIRNQIVPSYRYRILSKYYNAEYLYASRIEQYNDSCRTSAIDLKGVCLRSTMRVPTNP